MAGILPDPAPEGMVSYALISASRGDMPDNILLAADPQRSAVVKASAGVGKTYLLVTRLIRLLLAGTHPESILAITFTRKAATEMQERLSERLLEFIECDETGLKEKLLSIGVEPEPAVLSRARHLYETILRHESSVRTTTFHAFCQDILRRFPLEADVPPGFELLERTGAYQAAAWEALYAEATQNPDSDVARALEYLFDNCGGLDNTQNALNNFLGQRSDWWAYTLGETDAVPFAVDRLLEWLEIDLEHEPYALFFQTRNTERLQELARLLAMHSNSGNLKHADTLALLLAEQRWNEDAFQSAKDVFFTQSGTPRKRNASKAQAKSMGDDGEQRFLELHLEMSAAFERQQDLINRHNTYHRCKAWYLAGQRLVEHYQRIKQAQRLLDFTDLEWRAFLLLNESDNALWVQYKLDQRIDHMLIDEFQDTNPTQWHLLLPLLEELASQNDSSRSMFVVGDEKQSIYSFRRADPRLLDTAEHWMNEKLAAQSYPMDRSRRSSKVIMDIVNHVFDREGKKLLESFHTHDTYNENMWGHVELRPLIEPEEQEHEDIYMRNPLKQARQVSYDTRSYREGQAMARKIKELVNTPVVIGEGKKAKPCSYGDVMILVRTRSRVEDYQRAFREQGIPYIAAGRGSFLEAEEIRDMLALLDVLSSPYNNLSLATVLRCPLFDCDERDLMDIVLVNEGDNWWEKLGLLVSTSQNHSRLLHAHQSLLRWQSYSTFLPIHDLLDKIYQESNIYDVYASAFPSHLAARTRQNLMQLINLALEVDSGRYPSVARFYAQLQDLSTHDHDSLDEGKSNENDAVRIMTIHASKGLEAPVVFLADSASLKQDDKGYRALVDWPPESQRPHHFLLVGKKDEIDSLTHELIDRHQQRLQKEDSHLLYVAMTRARQMLFISGCAPSRGEKLGWYGLLQQAWPNEELTPLTDGKVANLTQYIAPALREKISVPEELTQPLFSRQTEMEIITPSQLDAEEQQQADEDSQEFGILLHRAMEYLTKPNAPSITSLKFQLMQEQHLPDEEKVDQAIRQANALITNPDFAELFDASQFQRAYNEMTLQYQSDDGRWVQGIVDRLILTDDKVIVVDYKTHGIQSEAQQTQLTEHYGPQLQLYAQGAALLWPDKQVEACLLFSQIPKRVRVSLSKPSS